MIQIIILSIIALGLFLLFFYIDYQLNDDYIIYKAVDESCYYCVYSTKPHSIRDKSKNTCKRINNQNWTSTQIRNCKYRVKE